MGGAIGAANCNRVRC